MFLSDCLLQKNSSFRSDDGCSISFLGGFWRTSCLPGTQWQMVPGWSGELGPGMRAPQLLWSLHQNNISDRLVEASHDELNYALPHLSPMRDYIGCMEAPPLGSSIPFNILVRRDIPHWIKSHLIFKCWMSRWFQCRSRRGLMRPVRVDFLKETSKRWAVLIMRNNCDIQFSTIIHRPSFCYQKVAIMICLWLSGLWEETSSDMEGGSYNWKPC